jgi:DUF4097 and DUF4098 domain-containing protein YvlB
MTGCMFPQHRAERIVKEQLETSPLQKIDLSTFNGAVTIKTHDKPVIDMDIKYIATGDSPEAAEAAVEEMTTDITADGGVLTLAAKKPAGQWGASAAYTLVVPHQVALKLQSSNGAIEINGTSGDVDVSTSNGSISLTAVTGGLKAHTSNGRITAKDCDGSVNFRTSNGRVTWEGPFHGMENEIRTSNGSLTVKLPEGFAAEVSASTSNGSIRCNVPVEQTIESKKRSMHFITAGIAGEQPSVMKLRTSNGSITVGLLEPETEAAAEDMSPEITPDGNSGGIAL